MGGRLRLVLTGGAPLSPDTHELIKICLCVQVTQGYGLTETCSSATVMDSKLNSCMKNHNLRFCSGQSNITAQTLI
jgi:long-subunit acyl-CoA synthetase (AMP-forming)